MRVCPNCSSTNPSNEYVYCGNCGAELDAAAPLKDPWIGRILMDQWTIVERIGGGGFGTVYKARDRLGRIDAVKIFKREALHPSDIEEAQNRFQIEADLLKSLGDDCAQIVGLRAFREIEQEQLVYFVMEYVEGRNLHDVLVEDGPMDVRRVVDIGKQLASALIVAHRNGVIHRDLKPANLMLAKDRGGHEVLKVLDFGVAKVFDEARRSKIGTSYLAPGTMGYASPEQRRPGTDLDGRSDLYAASVVLYSLLTGKEPWIAGEITDRTSRGRSYLKLDLDTGQEIPLREFNPQIPRSLERLILTNLNRRPEDRLPNAEAFLYELNRIDAPGSVDLRRLADWFKRMDESMLRKVGTALLVLVVIASLIWVVPFPARRMPVSELAAEASRIEFARWTERGLEGRLDRGVLPSRGFRAEGSHRDVWPIAEGLLEANVRLDATLQVERLNGRLDTIQTAARWSEAPPVIDSLLRISPDPEGIWGRARFTVGRMQDASVQPSLLGEVCQRLEALPEGVRQIRAHCERLGGTP